VVHFSPHCTERSYTAAVVFLALAVAFIPSLLTFARPLTYLPASVLMAASALCVLFASVRWSRYSVLVESSIAARSSFIPPAPPNAQTRNIG
jgi:hypothetical protein